MTAANGRKGLSTAAPAGSVWGSLAGAVGGGTCWLWIMASICRDWSALVVILALAAAIYVVAGRAALRSPGSYFRIAALATAAVAAVNIAAVILRWDAWLADVRLHPGGLVSPNQMPNAGLPASRLLLMIVPMYAILIFFMLARQRAIDRARKP